MSLEDKIKNILKEKGHMTTDEYMSVCLYDDEFGYYRVHDPIGRDGDFITSPEISQTFGEMIGAWLAATWSSVDSPKEKILVELGPGRGTLMKDILRATKNVDGFHDGLEVHLVEVNEKLRDRQRNVLEHEKVEIFWHDSVDDLPAKPIFLVANEFFDALPIVQFTKMKKGWRENIIRLDEEGNLEFGILEKKTKPCKLVPEEFDDAKVGDFYEMSPYSIEVIEKISEHIKKHDGAALIIDYGYFKNELADTFQSVKAHKYHNPLKTPGEADLTAHVNFPNLQKVAIKKGVNAYANVTQGELLVSLGIGIRAKAIMEKLNGRDKDVFGDAIKKLISVDEMGSLFKCMAIMRQDRDVPYGFYSYMVDL